MFAVMTLSVRELPCEGGWRTVGVLRQGFALSGRG